MKAAGIVFQIQLTLNFIWTPVFFGLQAPLAGLIIIIAMWVVYPLSKAACYLLIPYLLWVSFATILNGAIVLLN